MRALLLIDHGSRRAAANEMLAEVAKVVRNALGDNDIFVASAHMELAPPTIAEAFKACVDAGATEVIAHPYMLSPGRHATEDIPRLVEEAARAHPGVTFRVTPPLGVHEALAQVVLDRAGLL